MADPRTTPRTGPRRGLRRPEAADYVGISPSKFDAMVGDGRMPSPRVIDGCVIWDVRELDEAFDDLPRRGHHLPAHPSSEASDPWGDPRV